MSEPVSRCGRERERERERAREREPRDGAGEVPAGESPVRIRRLKLALGVAVDAAVGVSPKSVKIDGYTLKQWRAAGQALLTALGRSPPA